ncbi:MAG: hypothetical protein R3F59_05515 [Myxococcota bacterium]
MSDPRFTLDAIRPLVAHQRPSGRHLVVTFRCPQSGQQVNATWTAPQRSAIAQQVAARARQTAWYEARRQVYSLLRTALGTGVVGRMATDVATTAMNSVGTPTASGAPASLTAEEQEVGLVEAFQNVSGQFAWTGDRWVHRSAAAERASALERAVEAQPMSRYDRLLAARMLVQVAGAHGGVGEAERDHLADAIDPELGSLEALLARPPLTRAELGEATAGPVRVTLLSLAWALALVDEHGAPEEIALLDTFGEQLGLTPAQRREARDAARTWIVDQALERAFAWGGHDQHARDEVISLGERIGMGREEVELAEARFQKRRA